MIIERIAAKKPVALALVLALFAGAPTNALAQYRTGTVNTNAGVGVIGSVGAIGSVVPGVTSLPLTLTNLSLSAPALSVAPVLTANMPAAAVSVTGAPALAKIPVLAAASIPTNSPKGTSIEVAAALAVANTLPVGAVRDVMSSFIGAMSDKKTSAAKVANIFDASRTLSESDEAVDGQGGSDAAQALHKEWEDAAAGRVAAFEKSVGEVKVGRFGLKIAHSITQNGELSYGVIYTLDGTPINSAVLKSALQTAGVSEAEWLGAKAEIDRAVPELVNQLVSVLKQNDREHQAVHKKMDGLAKKAALEAVNATLKMGADLQAWGVPAAISVDQKTRLRYAKTYRLNGMPTDLGAALHELIAPFVAADPQFLSKVTAAQLHEAAQYVNDSLKYSLDEGTPDGMKRMRMGRSRGEGYDYPEARKALMDLARRKLTETPLPGDALAGLGPVPENLQPAAAMKSILMDLMKSFSEKAEGGASEEELASMQDLLIAMHAAMGLPVRTSNGMTMLPVAHRQLLPILAELRRRNTEAEVVEAVIRSFPMGESLLRLGIADLWAQGITGKGVKVAVIDNGIDFDHPDFADIRNPLIENMTRDRGVHTKGGHGTPMGSIVHAIAPDAEIQSYQALPNTDGLVGVALSQDETVQAVLKAMDRAKENGANIISMSLGFPMAYANDPVALKVAELVKAGIVVIVSAGNEGGDLPKGMQIRSPASSPDAIAVGAVDYHGVIASFSSEGVVFNPSDGTAAEKPDIYAPGVNIKAATQLPGPLYEQEPVPYNPVSGTSPAAPHVTGVAALMLGAALAAGADITSALVPGAVRESLKAGVVRVERLPVLTDAEQAVKDLVARMTKPGV